MKICFVCDGYPPARRVGGIEHFTQTLAEGLIERDHTVSVVGFCAGLSKTLIQYQNGVRVIRLAHQPKSLIARMLTERWRLESTIGQEIQTQGIEIVESPDCRGPLLFGRFGVPLVVRMHGATSVEFRITGRIPPRFTPFFEKRTLRMATQLVAVSCFIRNATLHDLKSENAHCPVIYNGINTKLFTTNSRIKRIPGRILFVGRLSETKGAPALFSALPIIFEQYPRSHLRFIGLDPLLSNGNRASKLFMDGLPAQYHSRVHLIGELPNENLPNEYRQASIALFPSRVEAHPLSVLEAMACGTPTVFMKHGPGPEIMQHRHDGLLCNTDDPRKIAESVLELLRTPAFATKLGERAAEKVHSHFSIDQSIPKNEEFYRNLAGAT